MTFSRPPSQTTSVTRSGPGPSLDETSDPSDPDPSDPDPDPLDSDPLDSDGLDRDELDRDELDRLDELDELLDELLDDELDEPQASRVSCCNSSGWPL